MANVQIVAVLEELQVAKLEDVNSRATAAQGAKADSAIQQAALDAAIATRATSAQGAKADSAIQQATLDSAIATRATAAQGAKADAAVTSSALGITVATLVAGMVPASQLPSFVDDVIEVAHYAALPATGESGKIYVTDVPYTAGGITSSQFRWSGSAYAPIIASPGSTDAVTEGATNKYFSAALVRLVTLANLTLTNAAIVAGETYEVMFGKLQAQINAIIASLGNKVDKVTGYGLSKNDYSDAAATVVASVAAIGTNATKGIKAKVEVALSDEATALTTGTKLTVHVAEAMTLTEVFGGLSTVQAAGALLAFDVKKNGTSIFTTKPTIDNTEETTLTAATPPVLNGTVTLAKGDKLTFSIDAVGDGSAKGLKVYLLGAR